MGSGEGLATYLAQIGETMNSDRSTILVGKPQRKVTEIYMKGNIKMDLR